MPLRISSWNVPTPTNKEFIAHVLSEIAIANTQFEGEILGEKPLHGRKTKSPVPRTDGRTYQSNFCKGCGCNNDDRTYKCSKCSHRHYMRRAAFRKKANVVH